MRFSDLEKSRAFVERTYPMIYLYGSGSTDSDDQAAKVRIAFSRERDDRARGEKADGEWTCKILSLSTILERRFTNALKVYICQLSWKDQVFSMPNAADKFVCS